MSLFCKKWLRRFSAHLINFHMSKTIRLAAVTSSGRRYIVQKVDLAPDGTGKVHCWGEVIKVEARSFKTTHSPSVSFALADVVLSTEEKTAALCSALFAQMVDVRRAAGRIVTLSKSGRTATDLGPRK
jgi:hypothetical protein